MPENSDQDQHIHRPETQLPDDIHPLPRELRQIDEQFVPTNGLVVPKQKGLTPPPAELSSILVASSGPKKLQTHAKPDEVSAAAVVHFGSSVAHLVENRDREKQQKYQSREESRKKYAVVWTLAQQDHPAFLRMVLREETEKRHIELPERTIQLLSTPIFAINPDKESIERIRSWKKSLPGPVEQGGIILLDTVVINPPLRGKLAQAATEYNAHHAEKGLNTQYAADIVAIRTVEKINYVLRLCRRMDASRTSLPEMPDLSALSLTALETARTRDLRLRIYDMLLQLKIPESQRESILFAMQEKEELTHPLAFRLTTEIAASPYAERSAWLMDQYHRRDHLLELLSSHSEQELFDHYDELTQGAKKLVMAINPERPPGNKVGLEIEFGEGGVIPPLDKAWDIEDVSGSQEGFNNFELRRSVFSLTYDNDYLLSLSALPLWFSDGASHLSSIHFHFDQLERPNPPSFGHLFFPNERLFNSLGTWELRNFVIPSSSHDQCQLLPGIVTDLIALGNAEAKADPERQSTRLHFDPNREHTWEELVFGHILFNMRSPEARLAAIHALTHPYALRAFNPIAFTTSFDNPPHEIGEILANEPFGGEQRKLIEVLPIFQNIGLARTEAKIAYVTGCTDLYDDPQVKAGYETLLSDPEASVRITYLDTLGPLMHTNQELQDRLFQYLSDVDPHLQESALNHFGGYLASDAVREKVTECTDSPYDNVRRAATNLLRGYLTTQARFDPELIKKLSPRLTDSYVFVRTEATRIFAQNYQFLDEETKKMALLPFDDDSGAVRATAAGSFIQLFDEPVIHEKILSQVKNPDPQARTRAIMSLEMYVDREDVQEAIFPALYDPNRYCRQTAMNSLRSVISSPNVYKKLQEMQAREHDTIIRYQLNTLLHVVGKGLMRPRPKRQR